jgi:2-dehydro-3-deoxyphosphogalactonate aldolase
MTLPLIAILRGVTPERILSVADILLSEGFHMLEVPLNSPDALSSIQMLADKYLQEPNQAGPSEQLLLLGAGTVATHKQAEAVVDSGANLVVSPNFNRQVIEIAKHAQAYMCCGVFTPSEAFNAIEAGADCLKLFPANVLKADGLKALRSVLPAQTQCFPVGGIEATEQSMMPFYEAGANGFGVGSALFHPSMSDDDIQRKARDFASVWRGISKPSFTPVVSSIDS